MRISGNTTFLQSIGSLVAFKSNISFEGHCTFLLNRQQQVGMHAWQIIVMCLDKS